jgi:predicted DNA-binding transcriptional regulator AlpA
MAENTDLMTTPEAAALVRRPQETLRYWRWRGEGPPSFKIGRRVLYDRAELLAWITAQKHKTASGDSAA